MKCHANFRLLQKGAEELLLRMPIKVRLFHSLSLSYLLFSLKDKPWYRDLFDMAHIRDPFEFFDPKVPDKFQHLDCFTAPYVRKNRAEYESFALLPLC